MILELDDEYVTEVLEILCAIPFEHPTMHDTEPPTTRHAGIEQLIKQLDTELNAQADADTEMAKSWEDSEAEEQARYAEAMAGAEEDEYHEDYEGR